MTGWATGTHLRMAGLRGTGPGRLPVGVARWRDASLPPLQSLLIMGQTQTFKTSRLVAPILRSWHGPAVATSVKADLQHLTADARNARGPVWNFDPTDPSTDKWNPLDGCHDWEHARKMASWLTEGASSGGDRDDNWWEWSEKMLAPMLHAGARARVTMATVARWLDTRDFDVVARHLPAGQPAEVWEASISRPEKQQGSILSYAESTLKVFSDPGVADATATSEFAVGHLLDRNGTLYVVGHAHEQKRLAAIYLALVRTVLNFAVEHQPLDPPLLLVLDEVAHVAPLEDLPTVAATCAGMGIQLVTVVQDDGQIRARWGNDRATSMWQNHPARVVLPSGSMDFNTLDRIVDLLGERTVSRRERDGRVSSRQQPVASRDSLYQMPKGQGVLLSGSCPPARLRLKVA